jgi:hypothetical protein
MPTLERHERALGAGAVDPVRVHPQPLLQESDGRSGRTRPQDAVPVRRELGVEMPRPRHRSRVRHRARMGNGASVSNGHRMRFRSLGGGDHRVPGHWTDDAVGDEPVPLLPARDRVRRL